MFLLVQLMASITDKLSLSLFEMSSWRRHPPTLWYQGWPDSAWLRGRQGARRPWREGRWFCIVKPLFEYQGFLKFLSFRTSASAFSCVCPGNILRLKFRELGLLPIFSYYQPLFFDFSLVSNSFVVGKWEVSEGERWLFSPNWSENCCSNNRRDYGSDGK